MSKKAKMRKLNPKEIKFMKSARLRVGEAIEIDSITLEELEFKLEKGLMNNYRKTKRELLQQYRSLKAEIDQAKNNIMIIDEQMKKGVPIIEKKKEDE